MSKSFSEYIIADMYAARLAHVSIVREYSLGFKRHVSSLEIMSDTVDLLMKRSEKNMLKLINLYF